MNYRRLSEEERRCIHRWCQQGHGVREMGRRLDRSPSSISREMERNTGRRGYRPKQAHEKAQAKGRRPGRRRFTESVRADVVRRLKDRWTPEMISRRARWEGRPWVCRETIYRSIYADAKRGGTLWQQLPRAKRKRQRRCPRLEGRGRGRIPNQRMIDTRPAEVETRGSVGHWEGDLINGASATGHLVTLVERLTRFSLIGRTQSKAALEVNVQIQQLFHPLPSNVCLSVTFDNGKEFALHEALSCSLGMDVYFAHPYHSWERGTNENTNGLIRRLHPKKSSFAAMGEKELQRLDSFLNDRPRKCLGWRTPREAMAAFLVAAP